MEDRIRVLRAIKTDEDREKYEEYLNRYITEYNWFINSKNPLESIRKKALQYEVGSDARNALESRARLIEIGEYGNALERNITSYFLALEEDSAKKEKRSPYDIIKGILQKDEGTKRYLQKRYMKSRAEDSGVTLATPVNLNLQSKEDVLTQVFEECEFVRIEKPQNALVTVNAENNQMFTNVRNALIECLKENGIDVEHLQKGNKESTFKKELYNSVPIQNYREKSNSLNNKSQQNERDDR